MIILIIVIIFLCCRSKEKKENQEREIEAQKTVADFRLTARNTLNHIISATQQTFSDTYDEFTKYSREISPKINPKDIDQYSRQYYLFCTDLIQLKETSLAKIADLERNAKEQITNLKNAFDIMQFSDEVTNWRKTILDYATAFDEQCKNYKMILHGYLGFTYDEVNTLTLDKCGIYCIENTLTHQCYIGQAIDIVARWKQHIQGCLTGEKKKLYRVMREDGLRQFKFSVLEECPPTILDLKECEYIKKYDSVKNGYNSNNGNVNKAKAIQEYLNASAI